MKIVNLNGREVLDNQGWPTIACDVTLDNGQVISAVAPTNLQPGPYEALALRDGGARLLGRGVQQAIDVIRDQVFPLVMGYPPDGVQTDLKLIELDGTNNKARLGANTLLAVSQAIFKAQAVVENMQLFELIALVCDHSQVTLPIPMVTLIEGEIKPNSTPLFREYLAIPYGAKSVRMALERSVLLTHQLRLLLQEATAGKISKQLGTVNYGGEGVSFGVEGGLSTNFPSATAPLDSIMSALEQFAQSDDPLFALGLDLAATRFYDHEARLYHLDQRQYTADKLIEYYAQICQKYPIYALEDAMAISDAAGWQLLNVAVGQQIHIASDELLATNPERIAYAAEQQMVGAVVLKPAQIGTITETIQAIKLCQDENLMTIIAHAPHENCDSFMVDLGVGSNATHLKLGGLQGGNQIAKYNRLLEIEDFLLNLQL